MQWIQPAVQSGMSGSEVTEGHARPKTNKWPRSGDRGHYVEHRRRNSGASLLPENVGRQRFRRTGASPARPVRTGPPADPRRLPVRWARPPIGAVAQRAVAPRVIAEVENVRPRLGGPQRTRSGMPTRRGGPEPRDCRTSRPGGRVMPAAGERVTDPTDGRHCTPTSCRVAPLLRGSAGGLARSLPSLRAAVIQDRVSGHGWRRGRGQGAGRGAPGQESSRPTTRGGARGSTRGGLRPPERPVDGGPTDAEQLGQFPRRVLAGRMQLDQVPLLRRGELGRLAP